MKQRFKTGIYFIVAVFLMAFIFNAILEPNNIAAGGITGFSLIIQEIFGIDTTIFVAIANFVLLILAFIFIGREFALKTIVGANILFPLFLYLIPKQAVIDDVFFGVVVAGVLLGIAVHFLHLSGGSTGGTTITGKIISKYLRVQYSTGIAISDLTVIGCGLLVFGLESTFYACTTTIMMTLTANFIDRGLQNSQAIHVITSKPEDLREKLLTEANVGITQIQVMGSYSQENRVLLVCVVKSKKVELVRQIISNNDQKAFMYTTQVASAIGEGFTAFEDVGR